MGDRDPHDMLTRYLLVGDVVRATSELYGRAWGRSVKIVTGTRGVVVQVHGIPDGATTYGIAFGEAFAHPSAREVRRVSEPWTAAWEAEAAAWAMSESGAYINDEPPDVSDPWTWDEDCCGPHARWPAVDDDAPSVHAVIEAIHVAGPDFIWRCRVTVDDGSQVAEPSGIPGPWHLCAATLSEAMAYAEVCRERLDDHYRDVASEWAADAARGGDDG